MSYYNALNILESRKIGTHCAADTGTAYFYTEVKGLGEVRLLVETKPGKLEEEFDVGVPLDTMELIKQYADAPMYVLLDDLEPLDVLDTPYGSDDPEGNMSLTTTDIEEDYRDRVSQIKSTYLNPPLNPNVVGGRL
jgi:hypothetical protein